MLDLWRSNELRCLASCRCRAPEVQVQAHSGAIAPRSFDSRFSRDRTLRNETIIQFVGYGGSSSIEGVSSGQLQRIGPGYIGPFSSLFSSLGRWWLFGMIPHLERPSTYLIPFFNVFSCLVLQVILICLGVSPPGKAEVAWCSSCVY